MIIIVVSGQSEQELSAIAENGLANAVLSKSELHDELLPLLQRLLPRRFALAFAPALTVGT